MQALPLKLSRRQWLAAGLTAGLPGGLAQAQNSALIPRELRFPADLGSHPEFSTEWWYLTGQLRGGTTASERAFGFQLTFFRSRVAATQGMQSAFAAKQLVFAHAALTDVQGKQLHHDQRIARAGFGVAQASENDTSVALRDWSLVHQGQQYKCSARGSDFQFELSLQETQALLLQGERGLSRKGPQAEQASYYYSLPQLKASGSLRLDQQQWQVQGTAWLDHEWSQALLHPQAVGWDWIGMNLLDGSALTAFRLRDKSGQSLWDGGSFRHPSMGAQAHVFSPGEVEFKVMRLWTSPLSRATYPVEWMVRTPADFYTVKAVIDNQELDSRQSTGAIYWEGLSDLYDSNSRLVGRGYLEMTGYASALKLT